MPENTNRPTRRRRFLTGVAVVSIAATGAAWSGCGDDDDEAVDEAINNANEQAEEIQGDVNEALDEANEQAEEATDEALDQADEAQNEADQALEDAPKP